MKKLGLAFLIILATTLLAAGGIYAKATLDYNMQKQSAIVAQPVPPTTSELLKLTNDERAKVGSPALIYSEMMTTNAQWKANDMVARGYWQHNLPGTDRPFDQAHMDVFAQSCKTVQENLAKNDVTSQDVMHSWMTSKMGHREAMLNSASSSVGFGITQQKDGTYLIAAEYCIAK